MLSIEATEIDVLEAGQGPLVVLVHSSVSGARQWKTLIERLAGSYRVMAPNLFGYGGTPGWTEPRPQSLADQAALIGAILPKQAENIGLVGHSFGGAVAMRAAANLGSRVSRVVLLEPNPFYLLRDNGCAEAFAEIGELRDVMKVHGAHGEWARAAERFANYWGGAGTWDATAPDRRDAFARTIKSNFHEWDAVMDGATSLEDWGHLLPAKTLVVYDPNTVRPIREIVNLISRATSWRIETVSRGGHMAPLTQPDVINPIVADFLKI